MSDAIAIVLLARHGRTNLNASGRLRGRLNPPLDEVGRAEAEALASALEGLGIGCVVSSPLSRSLQTAAPIATKCAVPLDTDDRLTDRDYGSWAGEFPDELIRRFGSIEDAPGVEDDETFSTRIVAAVTDIALTAREGAAVIVAHDAVNRYVLSQLVPALGPPGAIPQRTGCWNRLELHGGRWSAPFVDALP